MSRLHVTLWALLLATAAQSWAQEYRISYQGRLSLHGQPVTGVADFAFWLRDDDEDGVLLGVVFKNGTPVVDGLFQVELPVGENGWPANAFNGQPRWLDIKVRCPAGSGNYTTLTPIQRLTEAPLALALPYFRTFKLGSGAPNVIGGAESNGWDPNALGWQGVTVVGGKDNRVRADLSTIGGGENNTIQGIGGVIAGGRFNFVNGVSAFIGGGESNFASAAFTAIAGGDGNAAYGAYAAIGGGYINEADGEYASVGGGEGQLAVGPHSTIAGGRYNIVTGSRAAIAGGTLNVAGGENAFLGGGRLNNCGGLASTLGGGSANITSASYATVSGGQTNAARGSHATVPGGFGNRAGGFASFAAGRAAVVRDAQASGDADGDQGTFVWADDSAGGAAFTSTAPNQFVVRAAGGFGINTAAPTAALDVHAGARTGLVVRNEGDTAWAIRLQNDALPESQTGMKVTPDGHFRITSHVGGGAYAQLTSSGAWSSVSDRRAKTDIQPLSGLLDPALALSPVSFYFAGQDRQKAPHRHIGFIAQDVERVFPSLVEGQETKTLNYAGLSVVAIGALQEFKREKDGEIAALRAENDRLRAEKDAQIEVLSQRLTRLESLMAERGAPAGTRN